MSDFEQIPEIAERIKRSKMELQDNGNYWAPEWDSQSCCDQDFVNNFKKGWQHQQAIIDSLKAQLNNMEACYIEKKKQVEAVSQVLCELKESLTDFKEMDLYDKGYRVTTEYVIADLEKALRGAND